MKLRIFTYASYSIRSWLRSSFISCTAIWIIPSLLRSRLLSSEQMFEKSLGYISKRASWRPLCIKNAVVQPFLDLLNKPAGGEAYLGGLVFEDPLVQYAARHLRGSKAIDKPLTTYKRVANIPTLHIRQFWCGPISFHFGHQIADFSSRLLVSSLDSRYGELLWFPWRSASTFDQLLPWQKFILNYLNPGNKKHRILTETHNISNLIVYPQQARMRAYPTLAHLRALSWCEKSLDVVNSHIVYVSRSRYSSCVSSGTMLGAYAGEDSFEELLAERGVRIIYPEEISLQAQLEIYLGADILIFAEGSAQHGLELLGFDSNKIVFVICRRNQSPGMEFPLISRFPSTIFVKAVLQLWIPKNGVEWNGLAILDWERVLELINPYLVAPITESECKKLITDSKSHLQHLSNLISLELFKCTP